MASFFIDDDYGSVAHPLQLAHNIEYTATKFKIMSYMKRLIYNYNSIDLMILLCQSLIRLINLNV